MSIELEDSVKRVSSREPEHPILLTYAHIASSDSGWRCTAITPYTGDTDSAKEGGYEIKVRSLAYFGHSRLHAFSAALRI